MDCPNGFAHHRDCSHPVREWRVSFDTDDCQIMVCTDCRFSKAEEWDDLDAISMVAKDGGSLNRPLPPGTLYAKGKQRDV
jgi:hypothetical protein